MADLIPELAPLGAVFRQERIRAGYKQVDFAAALGVSQTLVSHAERGGATTTYIAHQWAELCGGKLTIVSGDAADEAELRRLYRDLDPADQKRLLAVARLLGAAPLGMMDGLIAALEAAGKRP